jgi:hypothetical protein
MASEGNIESKGGEVATFGGWEVARKSMYASASAIGAGYWFAVLEMDVSGSENGHKNLLAMAERRRVGSLNRSFDEVAQTKVQRRRREATDDKRWGTGSARRMLSDDGRHYESGNAVRRCKMSEKRFLRTLDSQNRVDLRRPTDREDRRWADTWGDADRTLRIFTYRSDEI